MHKNIIGVLFVTSILSAGCNKGGMGGPMIENGSNVSMHYTLTVDGKTVDTSAGKEPLSYVQGSGQIIPGLEEQLVGLKKGDKKNVTVEAEKGYGPVDPNAVQKVPKTSFQDTKGMKVGDAVSGQVQDRRFQAIVAAIDQDTVTLNFNHPLAGKTLNFEVEIVEVKAGT